MENIRDFVETQKKILRLEFSNLSKKAKLVIIQVGDNPASNAYVKGKIKDGTEIGIDTELMKFETITEKKLLKVIKKLNKDKTVDGIIVQLPLPKEISEEKVKDAIIPEKDVDGFNCRTKVVPCTPCGIMYYLNSQKFEFEGKNAVVIGRSDIVGKPMALELLKKNCSVTVLHSKTPKAEMKKYIAMADLLVVAVGKENLINDTFKFKPSAVVVDVGINRNEQNKLRGDCQLYLPVGFQTPVPGGVGLLTRVAVYLNLYTLVKNK